MMDRNILNYHFLKNTAETIFKIGCRSYVQDLHSHHTKIRKDKSNEELPEVPDSSFDLEGQTKNLVLQSNTLLNGLLTQNFTSKHGEILKFRIYLCITSTM